MTDEGSEGGTSAGGARRRRGRGSARAAMHARRARPPAFNPAASGQRGGRYRPLDEAGCRRIYAEALRVLDEIGMGEVPEAFAERACERGAVRRDGGRLSFPRPFVEDVVANAAKGFTLHGRDPRHDIEVGGDRVHFGTGGAAVQTLDLDTHRYRASTLADLHDFAALADALTNVGWFARCCIATDIEDALELDLNTAYALLVGTSKPVGTSFTLGAHVDPVIDMFDLALGGKGRFAERPFCTAHVSPVISPLRYGEDAVEVILACIRRGVPINAIVAAQSGATAAASMAGMLVQTLAETLAALILVNVFAPGHPTIFSNWPFVVDLRTGSFSGGGGEAALLNAAGAQLGNWLGLPTGAACSMSDSKAVDAQMGAEKALTALAAGLAGANMLYESSGMMASLLGASFEAFVVDDETLGHVNRVLRGVEIDDELLGFEAIRTAVLGDGHFLGAEHTLAAMERDYFYPTLADRDPPSVWEEGGAHDMWTRANARARELLARERPVHLDPAADRIIRERFGVRPAPSAVSPRDS